MPLDPQREPVLFHARCPFSRWMAASRSARWPNARTRRAVLRVGSTAWLAVAVACTPIRERKLESDAGTPRSATTREGTAACANGTCFWSPGSRSDCTSTGLPTTAFRPARADGGSPELEELYFGWTSLRFGGVEADSSATAAAAGQTLGLDLDGVCTNSTSCRAQRDVVSCRSIGPQLSNRADRNAA